MDVCRCERLKNERWRGGRRLVVKSLNRRETVADS